MRQKIIHLACLAALGVAGLIWSAGPALADKHSAGRGPSRGNSGWRGGTWTNQGAWDGGWNRGWNGGWNRDWDRDWAWRRGWDRDDWWRWGWYRPYGYWPLASLAWGLGWGWPYYGGYYGYTYGYPAYGYAYSPTFNYYSEPYPDYGMPAQGYSSLYPPGQPTDVDGTNAEVDVRVPANAQVWVEGEQTNEQGSFRRFESPPLDPNRDYTYTVEARWIENGRTVDRKDTVPIHAGDRVTVNFLNAPTKGETMTPATQTTPQSAPSQTIEPIAKPNRSRTPPPPPPGSRQQTQPY